MDKIRGRFGFMSYFINGEIRRIPVEFFLTSSGLMAWLDSGEVTQRPLSPVLQSMDYREIGGFPNVISLYEEEVRTLFVDRRFWEQSVEHKFGLLFSFQVLHQMRIKGYGAALAVEAALQASAELRASEQQILRDIASIYQSSESDQSERQIQIHTAGENGILYVAQ